MKKLVLTLTLAIAALLSFAQIPQTFSYQGVVRDAESKIVVEKPITVNVQILQGTDEGTEVYAETHEVTTNANGLMTFELGSKDAESFAKIDWSNAPYFVKTVAEFDGKQISGVSPLLAVPYALYAAKAGYAAADLSGYYSKEEVDALLAALESKIENGGGGGGSSQQGSVTVENGAIKAAFSISDSKQIYFSQGNLQYQASTGTWRFAEHQYDMIGSDNSNISSSCSGWIDLFGWGTSGWYSGANAYQPYSTSTSYSDYYPGGDYTNNLTGSYANADWGVYNKISNGGNVAGMWRTLTFSEWYYLISGRAQASRLMGQGRVNNVNGLILLPDGWETPSSVKFTYDPGNYSTNVYSLDEWAVMESYGAVFLPAAGYRYGTDVNNVASYGDYWSSSADGSYDAYCLDFYSDNVSTGRNFRSRGRAVRLVQDAE